MFGKICLDRNAELRGVRRKLSVLSHERPSGASVQQSVPNPVLGRVNEEDT